MKKKINKDHKEIAQLEERVKDLEDKWKRALADYANLEKRVLGEREQFVKFSNASLVDKILGVLDDLERAEVHLKDKGLTLAVGQFRRVLETEGVEEIKVLGERFDPESMDCVEITQGPKNIAVEICAKGYKLGGRVIRPAKVKVGKGE